MMPPSMQTVAPARHETLLGLAHRRGRPRAAPSDPAVPTCRRRSGSAWMNTSWTLPPARSRLVPATWRSAAVHAP